MQRFLEAVTAIGDLLSSSRYWLAYFAVIGCAIVGCCWLLREVGALD